MKALFDIIPHYGGAFGASNHYQGGSVAQDEIPYLYASDEHCPCCEEYVDQDLEDGEIYECPCCTRKMVIKDE